MKCIFSCTLCTYPLDTLMHTLHIFPYQLLFFTFYFTQISSHLLQLFCICIHITFGKKVFILSFHKDFFISLPFINLVHSVTCTAEGKYIKYEMQNKNKLKTEMQMKQKKAIREINFKHCKLHPREDLNLMFFLFCNSNIVYLFWFHQCSSCYLMFICLQFIISVPTGADKTKFFNSSFICVFTLISHFIAFVLHLYLLL